MILPSLTVCLGELKEKFWQLFALQEYKQSCRLMADRLIRE